MEDIKKVYSIGEVSHIFNRSDATLRKYEKDYNLKIPRDELGHRFYTSKEIDVFKQILNLKKEGANIHVIRKLLERSIDYKEQKKQSLELITIDKLTGQEFKKLILTQLSDIITERKNELSKQYEEKLDKVKEELTDKIRKEFAMQQKQIEAENQKLIDYIENKKQEKKGFFNKLFKQKR